MVTKNFDKIHIVSQLPNTTCESLDLPPSAKASHPSHVEVSAKNVDESLKVVVSDLSSLVLVVLLPGV